MNFHPASPILRVDDLNRSLAYYTEKLGFKQDWRWKDWVASVSRGSFNLMLSQGDQGHPGSWVWIGVGNVDELFEEYQRSGAVIRQPHEPYGSWMDMDGKFWPA